MTPCLSLSLAKTLTREFDQIAHRTTQFPQPRLSLSLSLSLFQRDFVTVWRGKSRGLGNSILFQSSSTKIAI